MLLGSPVTIDGTLGFAVWDPSTNGITMYGGVPAGSGGTALPNCVAIGAFTLSGDRTKVVEGSILSDGSLCVLDPETGSYIAVASGREFLFSVGVTPDVSSQQRDVPPFEVLSDLEGESLFLAILWMLASVYSLTALVPINNRIASWQKSTAPADWKTCRSRWDLHHRWRVVLLTIAFAFLIVGVVSN